MQNNGNTYFLFLSNQILKKLNKIFVLIFAFMAITIPFSYAEVDEFEEDDKGGFGIMEREREGEHDDDEGSSIGSSTGNLILLVTIGAIVASVGYTGYKILRTKRPTISKS